MADEIKFIQRLSPFLRNFKQKAGRLWNFSCPLCGDSSTINRKARGYIYVKRNDFLFKCHNCGECMSLGKLIKRVHPSLYPEYCLERYADQKGRRKRVFPKLSFRKPEPKQRKKVGLPTIASLPDDHPAKVYLLSRKIPTEFFDQLYFSENYKAWATGVLSKERMERYSHLREDSRIVLPCYSHDGALIGAQGRSFVEQDKKFRYVTIKVEEDGALVYGLERWKKNKPTHICEGPFDSLFLPNCVAAIGSDLYSVARRLADTAGLDLSNTTFVFDNEPRNKEILKLMKKPLDAGLKVCIWCDTVIEKDINEMILAGKGTGQILKMIEERTFDGLLGRLNFSDWRKV